MTLSRSSLVLAGLLAERVIHEATSAFAARGEHPTSARLIEDLSRRWSACPEVEALENEISLSFVLLPVGVAHGAVALDRDSISPVTNQVEVFQSRQVYQVVYEVSDGQHAASNLGV